MLVRQANLEQCTATERMGRIPRVGEVMLDVDTHQLFIGDEVTEGGQPFGCGEADTYDVATLIVPTGTQVALFDSFACTTQATILGKMRVI